MQYPITARPGYCIWRVLPTDKAAFKLNCRSNQIQYRLNAQHVRNSVSSVRYLQSLSAAELPEAEPNNEPTFVRLLLWALLIARKSLLELCRRDAESSWSLPAATEGLNRADGPVPFRAYRRSQEARVRHLCGELRPYRLPQGSVAQVFMVCGSFFQHTID